jgi:hypothetical protein
MIGASPQLRHPSAPWRRLVLVILAISTGLIVGMVSVAFAYWLVTVTSGANYAEATAQTMPTGATPTVSVSPAAGQNVTITFPQMSTSGGSLLSAYAVNHFASGSGTSVAISGACAITSGTVTCTDVPGPGIWQYTDTPEIATSNWIGPASTKSGNVIVQASPTLTTSAASSVIVSTPITPSATLASATTTPPPGGSISFSVYGPSASAPSTCTGAGWTGVGSPVSVSANASYTASSAYTPSAVGTYWWYSSYTGDSYNTAAISPCNLASTVVQLSVTPISLAGITVYAAGYSQTITASGGTGPYSYAVTAGTLPTGLTLASSTGIITGTISAAGQAGSHSFTITATDHNGLTGTDVASIVVSAPNITLSALGTPAGEVTDSATVSASGGAAAYTYAVTSGSIPTGTSLSSGGVFSGTPNAAGTYSFTVTATDAKGYPGSRSYTMTPAPPAFTISPALLPAASVYSTYTQTLSTTGGVSAYSYSESGTLPVGLTLSSAGVLSGTINALAQNGSYSVTVTSTDADGFIGTRGYTLVVNAPSITLSPSTVPTVTVYAAYLQTVSSAGGVGPYAYSESGALPTGLTLSSTGVLSGTISAAGQNGTFNFTVASTDAHGYTGARAYTLVVNAPIITIAPTTLPTVVLGLGYSHQLTATATGYSGSYTYAVTSGTLPGGLALSASGRVTATTGLALGTYNFTVTATDTNGYSGSQAYSIVVIL